MRFERTALFISGLLIFGLINQAVWQKEGLLETGQIVRLKLAPVDPRSLMQGDYMALNFELTQKISEAPKDNGRLVITLDASQVASLRHIDDGSPLGDNDRMLQYRIRRGRARITTDAWFFQEGQANLFNKARYGEFRSNAQGEALLTGLLDEQFKRLGPAAKVW